MQELTSEVHMQELTGLVSVSEARTKKKPQHKKKKRDTDAARQGAGTERDPHRHPYKHRKRPTYLKSAREKPKGLRPGV